MITLPEAFATLSAAGIRFSRKDYMAGACDHKTYEEQFVTDAAINMVRQYIGAEVVNASTDEYMNDIPLHKWDALASLYAPHVYRLIALSNMTTQDPQSAVPCLSSADKVCLLKAAARQLKTVL